MGGRHACVLLALSSDVWRRRSQRRALRPIRVWKEVMQYECLDLLYNVVAVQVRTAVSCSHRNDAFANTVPTRIRRVPGAIPCEDLPASLPFSLHPIPFHPIPFPSTHPLPSLPIPSRASSKPLASRRDECVQDTSGAWTCSTTWWQSPGENGTGVHVTQLRLY